MRANTIFNPSLPAGWKMYRDAEGVAYYYNTVTDETRWTSPEEPSGWVPSRQEDTLSLSSLARVERERVDRLKETGPLPTDLLTANIRVQETFGLKAKRARLTPTQLVLKDANDEQTARVSPPPSPSGLFNSPRRIPWSISCSSPTPS